MSVYGYVSFALSLEGHDKTWVEINASAFDATYSKIEDAIDSLTKQALGREPDASEEAVRAYYTAVRTISRRNKPKKEESQVLRDFFFHFYPADEDGKMVLRQYECLRVMDELGVFTEFCDFDRLTLWRSRRMRRMDPHLVTPFNELSSDSLSRMRSVGETYFFFQTLRSKKSVAILKEKKPGHLS